MGVGISKTPEGVAALKNLSASLLQELENISRATDALQHTYEGVRQDIAHEDEVWDIIEDIRQTQSDTCVPVASLSQKAAKLANLLEQFINGGLGAAGN